MTSIAIIINSCEKYCRNTIDPIIESSKKAKIPAEIYTYIIKKYTDTDRMASEYNEPGIIKYQANWGQGGSWNLEL